MEPTESRILDLTRDDYDNAVRANLSTLKHLAKSPAHYLHALTNRGGDTDAKKVGRAVHVAIYEPERYASAVAVWDGGTRRGKEWESFKAANADRDILTEDEAAHVTAIANAVRSDKYAAPHLVGGRSEVTVLWTARAPASEGMSAAVVPCKSRLDYLRDDEIVDLKTCRDASPNGFGRQAWNLHYFVQAAFYVDAVEAATGKRPAFRFIAVESKAPHIVQVYRVPEFYLDLGRQQYRDWLRLLVDRRGANEWPGYFTGETDLEPPRWAVPNDEEDISDLGLVIGGDDEAA